MANILRTLMDRRSPGAARGALAALFLFLAACDGLKLQACTEIGCSDGFGFLVRSDAAWLPGSYALSLDLPDRNHACSFELPLEAKSDGRAPAAPLVCVPALELAISGVSQCDNATDEAGSGPARGCRLLPQHYQVDGFVRETPKGELSVVLARDGVTLVEERQPLTYQEYQPNGPECAPTCRTANVQVTLPAP